MDLKEEVDFLNKRSEILKGWIETIKKTTQGEKVRNFYKIVERDLYMFEYLINTDNNLIQRLEDKQVEIPPLPDLPTKDIMINKFNPEPNAPEVEKRDWVDKIRESVPWKLILVILIILGLIYYVYRDSTKATIPVLQLINFTGGA